MPKEKSSVSQITSSLASLLRNAKSPGSFCASGELYAILPRIDVAGVGSLSFPVPATQAEQLIKVAERAPYGKGDQTLIDTNVRRAWQIAPSSIKIDLSRWSPILDTFIGITRTKLGLESKVQAELYKMLVYDQGSFFVSHRDTEKASGMFGTLIIVLPSWYEGGELIVSHSGRTQTITMSANEPSLLSWASFYADCLHELKPVTAGHRVALVYNLLRAGKAQSTPDFQGVSSVTTLLKQWSEESKQSSRLPVKVAYVLEHQYTPESLSFSGLKGSDAIAADIAKSASKEAQCALYLAMVSIEETGYAESDGWDLGEAEERTQEIEGWIGVDDSKIDLAPIAIEDSEISPPDALEDEDEDNVRFHEASGNEGASYEKSYRRAALIFWPLHKTVHVLTKDGPSAALPYIESLLRAANKSKLPQETTHWRTAFELASAMLHSWPKERDWSGEREAKMLSLLVRLQDATLVKRFIEEVLIARFYSGKENSGLISAGALLGLDETLMLVERLLRAYLSKEPEHCASLVFHLSQKGASAAFKDIAQTLTRSLSQPLGAWGELDLSRDTANKKLIKELEKRATFVVHVMRSLWNQSEAERAEEAALGFVQLPVKFPIDGVLLPAVFQLKAVGGGALEGFGRLSQACLSHLQARTSIPLEAPKDHRRPDTVACKCTFCKELKAFLVDPKQKEWLFKAAVVRRDHVSESIIKSGCDVTTTTLKKSVPYILKCIKTNKSYERRLEQRKEDLESIARLV